MRQHKGSGTYNKLAIPRYWDKKQIEEYHEKVKKRNARKSVNHKRNKQLTLDYQSEHGGVRPQIKNGKIIGGYE